MMGEVLGYLVKDGGIGIIKRSIKCQLEDIVENRICLVEEHITKLSKETFEGVSRCYLGLELR